MVLKYILQYVLHTEKYEVHLLKCTRTFIKRKVHVHLLKETYTRILMAFIVLASK